MADDEIVFAGQKHSIGRAQTQVFGITDKRDLTIRRAQTLNTVNSNRAVGVDPNLQNFANPMRDPRDIHLQQLQRGEKRSMSQPNAGSGIQVHMPVAARAVVAESVVRDDGTISNNEKLFRELKGIVRSAFFALSVIIGLLFAYLSFAVFTAFDETRCADNNSSCYHSRIKSSSLIEKVCKHGATIVTNKCDEDGFYLLYHVDGEDDNELIPYNLNELHDFYSSGVIDESNFYLTQINNIGSSCVSGHSAQFNGYTEISENQDIGKIWYEGSPWPTMWIVVSWIYLLFIFATEWFFWSYSTEFTKKIDNIAMLMWGLMRFGNYSYMFSIGVAYSLLVNEGNNIAYMIGDYSAIAVDLCVITGFISLLVPMAFLVLFLICLCLAICCSENDNTNCGDCGCSMREFHESCCSPCGEWFIPYSRFRSDNIVNDREQCLGDSMCYFMIFGLVFALGGAITMYTFFAVLFDGSYFHDGSAAGLYFGAIMVVIFETIWFWTADTKAKGAQHAARARLDSNAHSNSVRGGNNNVNNNNNNNNNNNINSGNYVR